MSLTDLQAGLMLGFVVGLGVGCAFCAMVVHFQIKRRGR